MQTVYAATARTPQLHVVHATTSGGNPISLQRLIGLMYEYDRQHPFYQRPKNRRVHLYHIHNQNLQKLLIYMSTDLPLKASIAMAKLKNDEKSVQKLLKLQKFHRRTTENF